MNVYRTKLVLILLFLSCGVGASELMHHHQQIGDGVRRAWTPPELTGALHVEVEVHLLRDGHIESVAVTKSSGHADLDLSVIDAMRKAEPLSVPVDDALFEKEFRTFKMTFHPEI